MHARIVLFLGVLIGTACQTAPVWAEFMARVITVHEGDRITIYHNGRHQMVYLSEIDCPELKQPYGKQAKHATAAYIGGREIVVRSLKKDGRGYMIADIVLPDGRNVSRELVKEGLAWARPASRDDRSLVEQEELARAEGKGLWSDPHPVPPWKWKPVKKSSRKFSN